MSDEPVTPVTPTADPTPAPAPERWTTWIARVLVSPPLLIGALVAGAVVLFLEPFGQSTTFGRIVVDTPEIYTRERLVNDRFLQDAWLSRELEREAITPSQHSFTDRRSAAFRAGKGDEEAGPAAGGEPAKGGEDKDSDVRMSSRALLLEKVDYRDVVRNLAIENQLDDRHDLNGNSLYKLKFDAAVLPGANTQAGAQISVRLMGPSFLNAASRKAQLRSLSALGSAEDIEAWRRAYSKWIENLGSRLNQTQRELKQAYQNNEFAHNDYARLIAFLSRNLRVTTSEVAKCPPQLVELHGQDRKPLRLPTEEHNARKACVTAVVEKTVVRPAFQIDAHETPAQAPDAKPATMAGVKAAPPAGAKPAQTADANVQPQFGEYLKTSPPAPRAAAESEATRAKVIADLLDYRLNAYFAVKTVQLVLGLSVPESSFVDASYYTIPAFQPLVQLTFFNPYPKDAEGDVFTVKQRVAAIAAIDPAKVKEDDLNKLYAEQNALWARLYETNRNPGRAEHKDFAANLPKVPLNVSGLDLQEIVNDDMDLTAQPFKDVFGGRGVYVARAEVGLLNFARMARKQAHAFTYSVTPKESSDSVSFTLSTDSTVAGGAPLPGEAGKAGLQMRREALSRSLERRNAVVGFSSFSNDGTAEFGWLISPRHTAIEGQRYVQVQTPGQYPLSALVSLPSWWNQVRLEVTTSWVGRNGALIRASKPVEHVVDVPTDFEPLESILLGIEQLGPELMESRLDPVLLTACRPGAIVIPGRRLWRSTKVTLGYQTADSIAVLPNMKGIIARFAEVQNQVSVSEAEERPKTGVLEIRRAVRVWTSQGSITLPTPARIGITDECMSRK